MRLTSFLAAILLLGIASPPPVTPYVHVQRLVDIGNRRLNVYCMGAGSPTVVLDSGLSGSTWDWHAVQGDIAKTTRVCSYDRAGMGFSDPAPAPRDAAAIVSDLHTLLSRAQIPGPYVLVGHSVAGLYEPLFADRFPRDVVGMVLIDPSFPYQDREIVRLSPTMAAFIRTRQVLYAQCATAAASGTLATDSKTAQTCGTDPQTLTLECRKDGPDLCMIDRAQTQQFRRSAPWSASIEETEAMNTRSSAENVREQRHYGALPLIVLTAGKIQTAPGETKAEAREFWLVWKHAHDRLASMSTVGANFVVDGAGHYIQYDRPSVVVSAVDEVITQARARH